MVFYFMLVNLSFMTVPAISAYYLYYKTSSNTLIIGLLILECLALVLFVMPPKIKTRTPKDSMEQLIVGTISAATLGWIALFKIKDVITG